MGRALGQRGHKVSFAEDGEEFLEVCNNLKFCFPMIRHPVMLSLANYSLVLARCFLHSFCLSQTMQGFSGFDVVLMDRYMPRLEGPEAIR